MLPVASGSKRPVLPRWPETASVDPVIITKWFGEIYKGCNIGIATGERSGIVVLDVDPGGEAGLSKLCGALGPLPITLEARTARGGAHLVFRYPPGKRLHNRVALLHAAGVDVRGDAGQVVACPSTVGGAVYRWMNWGVEPAELPAAWAEALEHRIEDPPPPREADAELGTLRNVTLKFLAFGATEGSRNDSLFKAAVELVGAGYGEAEIWRRCLDAADRCVPPLPRDEAIATIRSALSRPRTPYRESFCDLGTPASPTPDAPAVPAFAPFPMNVLPEPIRSFVADAAKAIGCDPSYVALPALAGLASAIGNTHRIALKRGWTEPAIVWTAIVGESGTAKSPALELPLRPIRKRQHEAMKRHAAAMEEYREALAVHERHAAHWKRSKSDAPPPARPEAPIADRCWTDDATTEALAVLLQQNARGLLMVRDELSGWVFGFDRYSQGGRGGTDVARWLEMFGGRPMVVDRKTGGTLYVPRAAVSIAGGIQPETLQRALGQEHRDNGLAARLLFAMPPRRVMRWTEAAVDTATEAAVAAVFDRLFSLAMEVDPESTDALNPDLRPRLVRLADDGKRAWVRFYNEHATEQVNLSGDVAAAWSKLEGYAARLALVIHLTRWAADDATLRDPASVDEASITAGVVLARWFGNEARRVYAILCENEKDRARRQLIEWIERKGGDVSGRELVQASRAFDTVADAEAALTGLVEAGAGSWVTPEQRGRGGPKARRFVLSPVYGVNVYRNAAGGTGNANFVDVDGVDTPTNTGENGDSTKLENVGTVPAT